MKPELSNEEKYSSEPGAADYRLFNPNNMEITEEDSGVFLATVAARIFIREKEELEQAKIAFSDTAFGTLSNADHLKDRLIRAKAGWESAQYALLPFIRDSTLGKTEFAHLADEMEIIDWCPFEELPKTPKLKSPSFNWQAQANKDVSEARKLAEKLRNELWKHVRKEGDPEKPTKLLPWEKPKS